MLQRKALRDDVYTAILDLLMSGEVKPNESLAIDGLAKRFGVSPTPVREALAELEHTGLVTRAALRGYRVAPMITEPQIHQLVDARIICETAAVERSFEHRDAMLPQLEEALKEHRAAADRLLKAKDSESNLAFYRKYFESDWSFHQIFLDFCDNEYLSEMTNRLSFNSHRLRQAVGTRSTDARDAIHEHEAILEAFATGTAADAKDAMADHLNHVLARSVADLGQIEE